MKNVWCVVAVLMVGCGVGSEEAQAPEAQELTQEALEPGALHAGATGEGQDLITPALCRTPTVFWTCGKPKAGKPRVYESLYECRAGCQIACVAHQSCSNTQ